MSGDNLFRVFEVSQSLRKQSKKPTNNCEQQSFVEQPTKRPFSPPSFSLSQVPVTHFFPFSPSSFFVDTTLFNFYSFHLLIPFTIKSEPFHSSIIVPSYISYINHFPYCQKHYLPFLPNLINCTYSLSFSLLSIFITYLRLQTTLFVSKPLYYSIALRSSSLSTSFVDHSVIHMHRFSLHSPIITYH